MCVFIQIKSNFVYPHTHNGWTNRHFDFSKIFRKKIHYFFCLHIKITYETRYSITPEILLPNFNFGKRISYDMENIKEEPK